MGDHRRRPKQDLDPPSPTQARSNVVTPRVTRSKVLATPARDAKMSPERARGIQTTPKSQTTTMASPSTLMSGLRGELQEETIDQPSPSARLTSRPKSRGHTQSEDGQADLSAPTHAGDVEATQLSSTPNRQLDLCNREPRAYSLQGFGRTTKIVTDDWSLARMVESIVDPKVDTTKAVGLLETIVTYWEFSKELQDQYAEYILTLLGDTVRYREICRQHPSLEKRMMGMMARGVKAQGIRATMRRNLEQIRDFVGHDFFEAYIFEEMAPNVATHLWALCRWTYDNAFDFAQIFTLLTRIRAERMQAGPSRGVSPTSRLMAIDCERTQGRIEDAMKSGTIWRLPDGSTNIDLATLADAVSVKALNQHNMAMKSAGKEVVLVDEMNFLHYSDELPNIIKANARHPSLGGCVITNAKGQAKPRKPRADLQPIRPLPAVPESPPKRIRLATPDSTSDEEMETTPLKKRKSVPAKRPVSPDAVGSGPASSPQEPLSADAEPELIVLDGQGANPGQQQQRRHWGHEYNILQYRATFGKQPDDDPSNLVEPRRFSPQQFGLDLSGVTLPANRLKLTDKLAEGLFSQPGRLVKGILDWSYSVQRCFEEPGITPLSWQDITQVEVTTGAGTTSRPAHPHEIVQALAQIDRAIVPPCSVDGNSVNSIFKRNDMPVHSVLGVYNMLRTMEVISGLHCPGWVEMTREMISSLVDHYGPDYDTGVVIGSDARGREICLWPRSMTMDNLTNWYQYKGWWGTSLLLPAARYVTRGSTDVQVTDPDDFRNWYDKKVRALPDVHDTSQVPIVMLPLNAHGDHWTLVVLNFRTRTCEYLDSCRRTSLRDFAKLFVQALGGTFEEWKVGTLTSQGQENGSDCGLWVVANIAAYARDHRAAGPQSSAGLRLWLNRILSEALLNVRGPNGARTSVPNWTTEDMGLTAPSPRAEEGTSS